MPMVTRQAKGILLGGNRIKGILVRLPSCCAEFYTKFRTVFSSRGENVSGCFIISAIDGGNTSQQQYGSKKDYE